MPPKYTLPPNVASAPYQPPVLGAPFYGGGNSEARATRATDLLTLTQDQIDTGIVAKLGAIDPMREYVAGGNDNYIAPMAVRALPMQFDDVSRDFGIEIYEQMMHDPAVASSVETLKTLTLAEPLRSKSAIEDAEDPDFEKAQEYADFMQHCIDHPDRPLVEVVHEMLDALWRGSYVAEVVLKEETGGKYKGKYTLKKVAPKNPNRYWLVVDRFYEVLGVVRRYSYENDATGLTFQGRALVPREHLALLSFWGIGGDPRGNSILRPAYIAWYVRQQAWPAYLKWLTQWATPSLIGFTPVNATGTVPVMDPITGLPTFDIHGQMITESPEDAMLRALIQWQGGTAAALVGGSQVEVIKSEGNGQAWTEGLDMLKREIVLAILRVTRVTLEAKHGSKADSSDAHDLLSLFCDWIKQHVVAMLQRDVVEPIMRANYGEDSVYLAPKLSLAGLEKNDVSKLGAVIASLFAAGYIDDDQLPGIDALLNLPERDMIARARKQAEAEDAKRAQGMAQQRLMNPASGGQPKPTPAPAGDPTP